ncbi:MAG: hypothetical protein GXO76_06375 [Calditrichaeota bacterium]|nr:hypothetical protein [Calditrichota bacterium]
MSEHKEKLNERQDALFQEHYRLWMKNLPKHHQLTVDWQGSDAYSLSVKKIIYSTALKEETDWKSLLQRQTDIIRKELTFLRDAFDFIEMDVSQGQTLLRSKTPYKKEKITDYFQIVLKKGTFFQLTRVQNKNHKNKEIPFVLSWDIADRLVEFLIRLFS